MVDMRKLADLMKQDWDRRVSHDYRFWMSDGYANDEEMWRSGERDLSILLEGIESVQNEVLLELGCGVGRLLKAALPRFRKVVGIDVSEKAVQKAAELLGSPPQLELHVGNGYDLQQISDGSIDVVISFAALTSIPTEVVANYMKEIHRVLKPGGIFRLQFYLGSEQPVRSEDTLHLRCFKEDNFCQAVAAAGFEVQFIKELVLPFQVSFKEGGIVAVVGSFKRGQGTAADPLAVATILLPEGEVGEGTTHDLEYWMSLNYAKELVEQGNYEKARETLEYAAAYTSSVSIDLRDMLERIVAELDAREKSVGTEEAAGSLDAAPVKSSELLERNLRILSDRFPEAAACLKAKLNEGEAQSDIEARSTEEGPVLYQRGQCLDHPTKPVAGAASWSKRVRADAAGQDCEHLIVFGAGCGYHMEALLNLGQRKISLIEANVDVLLAAFQVRDQASWLKEIHGFSIGEQQDIPFIDANSELCMRPQSQAVESEYCSRIKSLFYGTRGLTALHPKIGVLGPMQGGTLPIAAYTGNALLGLKQRMRSLDVSGFAAGYHLVEDFIKDDLRKATTQGTYLETISQVLFESMTEKPIDILICMAQAPITGRVLTELRKRGVVTVLWFVEDFERFTYWRDTACYYDFVFTIQRGDCLEAIRAAGAGEVHYLPTGCDPQVHTPLMLSAEERTRWGSPISFVGAGYHNRQQMFASLCELPLKLWGTEWPTCRPFDRLVQEQGRRLAPEEYVKIFNATDINLNLHSSTERDGVDPFGDFLNPRTFELAAAGAFQLVDHRSLLSESFTSGKEVVTFSNKHELKDKIAYYLDRREEREQIAQAARERVLKEHTYQERLRTMLSIIYSSKYEALKQREEAGPWARLLRRAKKYPELYQRCQRAFERGEEPILDGLVVDIMTGEGVLTATEQKLLFLHHIKSQIKRMRHEEAGETGA